MKKIQLITTILILISASLHGQTFTRVTEGDIVNDGGISFGAAWGDYDNDGDLDLFVANGAYMTEQDNVLYQNNGDGTFTKIISGDIVNDGGRSTGSNWADYDNDDDLDLFVTNCCGESPENILYQNNGDGTFTIIITGDIVTDIALSWSSSWGDYNNDGDLDLFVANVPSNNNFLYQNNADGTFAKITIGDIVNDGGDGTGSSWGDYDNDGDLDLFVTNGSNENNFLYRNEGNDTFTKITAGDIVNDASWSESCSWADYDNDGDLDLFVTNANQSNALYTNNGDGTFTKVTTGDIVNDVGFALSAAWGDYDNDGDLDLFLANFDNLVNSFLYANNGDGTFTKITTGNIVNDQGVGTDASWIDYDNDGDLDLFVVNWDQNNFLYANNGNLNNWIHFKLVGTHSNSSGIGAKVRLKATIFGNSYWQMREISGETGRGGQNTLNAEFGLGDAEIINEVSIEWPSGTTETFTDVVVNQFMIIQENLAPIVAAPIPDQNPIYEFTFTFDIGTFVDVEDSVLTYTATKADDSSLPTWLTFDALARTFSGTPEVGEGSFIIKVTATDSGGLSVSDEFALNFLITGSEDLSLSKKIILYPNPATGKLDLLIHDAYTGNVNISVIDNNGTILFTVEIYKQGVELIYTIDLSGKSNGVYFIRVQTGNRETLLRAVKR